MSHYNDIIAEIGDRPSYPHRSDFTKYHGYAGGAPLADGPFDSLDAAKKAGAVVTEEMFLKDEFEAAKKPYDDYGKALTEMWHARVRADYPDLSDAIYYKAYSLAYEDGHSAGYGEVEIYLDKYIDFALDIIALTKA